MSAPFVRLASADFLLGGPHGGGEARLRRAGGNPDLAELLLYNEQGCHHPSVPGAFLVRRDEDAKAAFGRLEVSEAFCPDCKRLVLGVPGAPREGDA